MKHVLRERPLPAMGLLLVLVEAAAAAIGASSLAFSMAVLIVAPGLALAALLPAAVRAKADALLCAAPALGFAAIGVTLVAVARVGLPLEGWTVRLLVASLCLVGFTLGRHEPWERPSPAVLAGLAGAMATALVLGQRVVGEAPVPGNDWAKYALYADEIRRQGSLLIQNPFWMLGVPFREDPVTPAVYGSALTMTGAGAGEVVRGIQLFALMGVLGVFALVRAFWNGMAACLAAFLYAAVPVNHDILGWHGLPNVAALALLALVLAQIVAVLRGDPRRLEQVGLALTLVALAATHRLTAVVGFSAILLVALVALVALPDRRALLLRFSGVTLGWVALIGAIPALDLLERQSSSGGTQAAAAYRLTHVDLELAIRDLTIPFAVVGLFAVGWTLRGGRAALSTWPLIALLVVSGSLAYAWIVDLPLSYLRMVYFLPLALAPLIGITLGSRRRGLLIAVPLVIVTAVFAWGQAANVSRFYAFVDRASLRGLDTLAAQLRPGEVVVTDRCWSFLATWLLHTRTLPALAAEDIGPAAEVPFAARAREVFRGSAKGRRLSRRLRIRFVLADPTCVDGAGRRLSPPLTGRPVYISRRLTIIQLSR